MLEKPLDEYSTSITIIDCQPIVEQVVVTLLRTIFLYKLTQGTQTNLKQCMYDHMLERYLVPAFFAVQPLQIIERQATSYTSMR